MQIDPNSNPWFTPSAAPQGTSELDHLNKGLYAYVNAAHDPELKKQADTIFGRTVPFDNSETQATLIGRSWCSRSGYLADPVRYCRDNKLPLPPNWSGENAQLYTLIGQNYIGKAQELFNNQKAAREKALADAQKDYTETMGELPSLLAKSIRSAGGEKGTPLTPQYLEKLTKYGAREGAIQSQQRAATAWMYMSAYMDAPELLQTGLGLREKLLDIANTLSDDKGQLDPAAMSALVIMAREKALEKQTENNMLDRFNHALSSALAEDQDTDMASGLGRTLAYQEMIKRKVADSPHELDNTELRQAEDEAMQFAADLYSDKVTTMLSVFREAMDLSKSAPDSASFMAKAMSDMAAFTGRQILPTLGQVAGALATRGAGGGKFLQFLGGWAGSAYSTYDSNLSRAYADAVRDGKINPAIHASIQAGAESASEGAFTIAGSMPMLSKVTGKAINYATSRTAANSLARNTAIRTMGSYLGGTILEGTGELLEEELSNALETSLNKLARIAGVELTPVQYKMGEALGNMNPHEITSVFLYAALMGSPNIPSTYRAAANFAANSDNLLAAGHSPAAVRDIQNRILNAQDKAAEIFADTSLSQEQKKKQTDKLWEEVNKYQRDKAQSDIYEADPEEVRQRLQKQNKKTLEKAELALAIQAELDMKIAKKFGIIDTTAQPGDKFTVTLIEKGEKQADGSTAQDKLVQQEWTRNQLVNFFQIQKQDILTNSLRGFQSLVQAHAAAQTITNIDDLKIQIQELREIPYEAYASLKKHNGITTEYIADLIDIALNLRTQYEAQGMTRAEAEAQPSNFLEGVSLGELISIKGAAAERRDSAADTTEGKLKGITQGQSVEYGALNIARADGSVLIAYVNSRSDTNDLLEELLEAHIKHTINTTGLTYSQLGSIIKDVEKHLPSITTPDGKKQKLTLLPENKKPSEYTQSDIVEAYSKIALAHYLYNEEYLPITKGGHQLLREIGRVVDVARLYKAIGDAWYTYANTPEGKAHLANGGASFVDLLRTAGFKVGSLVAQAKATAQQQIQTIEASNWQPAIEDELDALLEDIEAEEQLAELNEQEANQPTTIPAEQSITGQEITVEPDSSRQSDEVAAAEATPATTSTSEATTAPTSEATTTPAADLSGEKASTILSSMRDLIAKGKARAEHFAIVFREIPGLTEAQAIEQGIRPLTQRGEPTAAYTQGKLLAERCTDVQYLLLKSGKLTQKAKRDILGAPTQTRKNPAWPKMVKKGIAPAEQRLAIIKALQNAVDYAAENPNYHLNFARHIITKGREYYIATDGRRLAVIERPAPKGSKELEESLDKKGNVVKDAKFPESWRQVMIALTDKAQTLDLAPFRFLETYPKTAINHVVWQDSQGKFSKYNPNYIGKGIKFFSSLSKAIGSPSTIQVDNQNMGPILMQSDHDGWTAKYLLMPMRVVDGDIYKEGDIPLNPQPASATFSIKPAAADTLDRFTADPLGERIIHHIRTEARRYARLLGDKAPYEQAVNAAQSAASIISAVDKFLHTPGKPVPARYRRQLQKLRSIAEKYAQIIASGTPRSFKKISPQEKQELEAAIAELEAQELETATTESDQLLTDSDRLTKREAAARAREHHRAIVRSAAKGRVYQTLSSMLETTAEALDSYLKHQLLQKLDRLTATVKIKRSPSKRLQGKMTAPAYRELERAINLMALSDRAYQDEIENVITAHETLARAINQGNTNLTSGNALLIQLADQLTTSGQQVTPQTLTAALANHEAALKIYGNVSSKNYEQTRLMANALFYLIRNGRNQWKAKHEAREAFIQQYLQHFLSHTPATSGTEQTARLAKEKEQKGTGFARFANSMMNSTQLFHALSGIEALAPLMEHTKQALATAGVARDLHMKQMVEQVQASYGRILGINPATTAGYSQRQLKEISAKLDKFYEQNNQVEQTNITRHYIDADGNHQTEQLKLTKWQALDLILTYRQQHYRPNAQEHGYTDELLAQLENWCGEDLLTLGNAMQQSIPNDGTIPVYEEREGIPLRDNPLYWPAHLNIAEQETPDHPAISNPYHAAGSYRFLKGRTSNLREVAARNAYNVWKSAIAERANYVYLAPITDTLNSLLARKEFAARLKTLIGPSLYEQLKLTLKEIDGTTWAETSLQEDPHGAIARTLRNMAPALLAGNPTTLIKQSSAIANATLMPDFPPHEFAKQLIKLQQNQSGITIGQILRLDTFKARVRDNSALNDMLALGTDAKYSTYANLARSWMGLIDATDTFFNAIGATLYYNHKYEQYTKENQENGSPLTQAEIHAKCETDITVMLALTAQPLKRTDKSAFFWRNSKTLLGPLYLYMGSEMINKVGMARANWLKRKAQGMGAAQNTLHWMYQLGAGVGGVAFLTSIACAILTGNTPDDDDSLSAWLIATYLHSAFGQYTSQMPVIGQIIDLALSPYAQFIDGVADFPGVKTATAAKKLGTMITDDKTYSGAEWQTQINRLARDLNGITGYWGGVNSQTRWLTVTSSILQTFTAASNWITPIAKGATHDAFFADWLPDWYTQTDTRSPRRSKSLIEQWLTPDTEESPRRRRSTTRRSTARARRRTTPRKRKRQEE